MGEGSSCGQGGWISSSGVVKMGAFGGLPLEVMGGVVAGLGLFLFFGAGGLFV